jgi:HAD superfamily hydrolase (TIGR01509 family)
MFAALGIDAVIFDMDGLLIDTERVFRDVLIESAADMGYEFPQALHRKMVGLPGRESDRLMQDFFGPQFSLPDYRRRLTEMVELRLGDGVPLRAGALELLDYLERQAIPKAVATSTGRQTAEKRLCNCGIRQRFQVVETSDDVVRGKPNPDIFLKAAADLGMLPGKCIVLEDSYNGIRAAHAAGIKAIMVPDLLEPNPEISALCFAVLDDLHQVRKLFSEGVACVS